MVMSGGLSAAAPSLVPQSILLLTGLNPKHFLLWPGFLNLSDGLQFVLP